jgi:hypothetical protein
LIIHGQQNVKLLRCASEYFAVLQPLPTLVLDGDDLDPFAEMISSIDWPRLR